MREYLAWKSIEAEKETLNLDNFQTRQTETKRAQFDEVVAQRIGETFTWVLVASQSESDPTVIWDETRESGPDALAVRVGKKLRSEEALITQYSGSRLRMDLDRVPLWRGDHVGLKQLWGDYSQYLYLPRLRDSAVLLDAVRSGLALLPWNPDTFACASAFGESTSRYSGLVGGQDAAVVLDATSVLVKPDIAARQIRSEPTDSETGDAGSPTAGGPQRTGAGSGQAGGGQPGTSTPHTLPTRFYGRVSLDSLRMLRDLGDIADSIVFQLGRADASVTISVEIDASAEEGSLTTFVALLVRTPAHRSSTPTSSSRERIRPVGAR